MDKKRNYWKAACIIAANNGQRKNWRYINAIYRRMTGASHLEEK